MCVLVWGVLSWICDHLVLHDGVHSSRKYIYIILWIFSYLEKMESEKQIKINKWEVILCFMHSLCLWEFLIIYFSLIECCFCRKWKSKRTFSAQSVCRKAVLTMFLVWPVVTSFVVNAGKCTSKCRFSLACQQVQELK